MPLCTENQALTSTLMRYHGRNWMDRGCTKVSPFCYALYLLLSIPSHCTMGGTGQTGVVPKCPPFAMPCTYCPSHPTVPWEGLDRQGLYQSVPFAMPYTYCPSHPIVPWEGLDRQGLYQSVPFGACPETPLVFHTLCPQIHTCPPIIRPISFCAPLGKKLKETLKDK